LKEPLPIHSPSFTSPLSPPGSTRTSLDAIPRDVIPLDVDKLLNTVIQFWESGFQPKPMKIPGVTTEIYESLKAKLEKENEGGSYYLIVDTNTLIVTTMSSPAHEALQDFLTDLKEPLNRWARIIHPGSRVFVTGAARFTLYKNGRERVRDKAPDQSFTVRYPGDRHVAYPAIVIEIGYSESETKLYQDASRWLLQSSGGVGAVLAFKCKAPSQNSDFSDISKWRIILNVYERYGFSLCSISIAYLLNSNLENPNEISLYGETIPIIPTPSFAPMLMLNARHLFPSTTPTLSRTAGSNLEFEVGIPDQAPSLSNAIDLMINQKREWDQVEQGDVEANTA
jgi:hypothetical protein